jgi:hypothetical protein
VGAVFGGAGGVAGAAGFGSGAAGAGVATFAGVGAGAGVASFEVVDGEVAAGAALLGGSLGFGGVAGSG